MVHAREDYNGRIQDSANRIPTDEPVFLLRAQDKLAVATVKFWLFLYEGDDKKLIQMVTKHIKKMEDWPKKKTPDLNFIPPRGAPVYVSDNLKVWYLKFSVGRTDNRGRLAAVPGFDSSTNDVSFPDSEAYWEHFRLFDDFETPDKLKKSWDGESF